MKHPETLTDLSFFGGRIREARKQAGLSQHALAERLGVSRNTVVNWESGRCTTDYQTALAVCKVLGLSPAVLSGSASGVPAGMQTGSSGAGHIEPRPLPYPLKTGADLILTPQPGAQHADELTADEQRLLQLYRQLSPDARLHGEKLLSALLPEDAAPAPAAVTVTAGAASAGVNRDLRPALGQTIPDSVDGNLFRLFAEYPGTAAAGTGTEFADTRPEPLILRRNARNARADALVRVSGDSMEPVYHDGDYLYFRFSDTARSGADVVCSTIHGTIVKRMGADGLFSVNPERPFRMKTEADNVRLLGVVTGPATPEDWPSPAERNVLHEQFHEEEKDFRRKYRLEDWE